MQAIPKENKLQEKMAKILDKNYLWVYNSNAQWYKNNIQNLCE